MSVNVKSVFLGSNAFTTQVKKQGTKGSMINIASVGAHRPRPGLVWYNASKGAITNVSQSFLAKRSVCSGNELHIGVAIGETRDN